MTRTPARTPLPFLIELLRPRRRALAAGAVSVVIVGFSALAIPYAIKRLLDPLITPAGTSWPLSLSGIVLALLFALNGGAGYFQATLFHDAAGDIAEKLRRTLMRRWLFWPPATLQRHEIGGLLSILQHDVESIYHLIAFGLAPLVQNALTLTGGLLIIAYHYWPMAFVLAGIIALPGLAVRARSRRIADAFGRSHQAMALMSGWLEVGLGHFIDVRVYHAEQAVLDRCAGHLQTAKAERLRAQTLQSQSAQLLYVVFCLLTLAVLLGGGLFIPKERAPISLLLMLFIYAYTSAQAAIGLYRTLGIFREARPCLERIADMLQEGDEAEAASRPPDESRETSAGADNRGDAAPIDPARAGADGPAEDDGHRWYASSDEDEAGTKPNCDSASGLARGQEGAITIKHMSFRYDGHANAVLNRLDLRIDAGSWVVITGESGSGKSTLIRLIAGLHGPVSGTLQVSGRAPWAGPRALNAADVAIAGAAPGIFPGSVEENVAMGRAMSSETIDHVLRIAQLSPADHREARAETLSAGEKARVGIARALAGDPAVLALDEATGPLDADTEAAFWSALRDARAGRTTVIVTHRPERVPFYDAMYRLDGGRLSRIRAQADAAATP